MPGLHQRLRKFCIVWGVTLDSQKGVNVQEKNDHNEQHDGATEQVGRNDHPVDGAGVRGEPPPKHPRRAR